MPPSAMTGGGFYNVHSAQQEEVSEAGVGLLGRAVAELSPDRPPDDRARVADSFYDRIRDRLVEEPVGCAWRIGLMRLRRRP